VVSGRRRINHVIQQLQFGVTGQAVVGAPRSPGGLWVVATENDKIAFDKWVKTVSDVVTAINDTTLDDREKFVAALKTQSLELKKLAGIPIDPRAAAAVIPRTDDALDDFNGPAAVMPAGAVMPTVGNPAPQPAVGVGGAALGAVPPGSAVTGGAAVADDSSADPMQTPDLEAFDEGDDATLLDE